MGTQWGDGKSGGRRGRKAPGAPGGQRKRAVKKQSGYTLPKGEPRGDSPVTRQRDMERADAYKETKPYRGAVRAAYKTNPTKERSARVKVARKRSSVEGDAILHTHHAEVARNAALERARARFTGMDDRDRRKADRYKQTPEYRELLSDTVAERIDRETDREHADILAGPRLLPGTRPGERALTAGKPARLGPTTRDPEQVALDRAIRKVVRQSSSVGLAPDVLEAGIQKAARKRESPALKVLNETLRPVRGVAGAAEKVVEGRPQDAPGAAVKGVVKNEGPLFGDVLRKAGAPEPVASVGGFALDVLADPTTYVTFGTGAVARRAAASAARDAAKRAAARGLSEAAQHQYASAAARQALKKHGVDVPVKTLSEEAARRSGQVAAAASRPATKKAARKVARKVTQDVQAVGGSRGVSMRVAGREVPGVRRATGKLHEVKQRHVGHVSDIVTTGKTDLHEQARQLRPQVRPKDVDRESYDLLRAELRGGRHQHAQATKEAERQAQAIIRALGRDEAAYARVIDAIERGKIGKLPTAAERDVARRIRDYNRGQGRRLRQAGVDLGDVRTGRPGHAVDYVRHQVELPPPSGAKRARKRRQRQGIQVRRTDPRPISVQNAEKVEQLSTDLPTLQGVSIAQAGQATEAARAANLVRQVGEPLKQGRRLADDEIALHVRGNRITEASEPAIRAIVEKGKLPTGAADAGGRYVVVKRQYRDEIERRLKTSDPDATLALPRNLTATWKKLSYYSPAFQGRNAIGDLLAAYGETSPREIAKGVRTGATALRAQSAAERAAGKIVNPAAGGGTRRVLRADPLQKTIKVAGERVTVSDYIDELETQGVVRSNRAFEFEEMLRGTRVEPRTGKLQVRRTQVSPQRWLENREDLMRVSTYTALRNRGMSKADASNMVANVHVDYGELSQVEKNIRSFAMPYYTWTARQLPEMSKRLVTRPGKAANIEKVRQETMAATGGDQDQLTEWEQRSVPLVIGIGDGKQRVIQFGAPQALLNETPNPFEAAEWGNSIAAMLTAGQVGNWDKAMEYAEELSKFGVGMVNPLPKSVFELVSGSSTFFREPIAPDYRPLRPAPSWVKELPEATKRAVGYTDEYVDNRTGKTVPGWRGEAGHLAQQFPGLAAVLNRLMTEGADKNKQTEVEKWLALTGVNSRTSDTLENAIGRLFEEHDQLNRKLGELKAQRSTPEREKARRFVAQRRTDIEKELAAISKALGYRKPLYANRLRKANNDSIGLGGGLGAGLGGGLR